MKALYMTTALFVAAFGINKAEANSIACPVGSFEYGGMCWSPADDKQNAVNNTNNNTASGIGVGIGKGGYAASTSKSSSDASSFSKSGSNSSSSAQGGNAAGGSASSNNAVNVNSSTRIKHSAASAIAPQLNGYGVPNCFGDVNPSGSFVAGMQTFEWGVAAGSSKASNVCAVYAIAGPAAAMAYLQRMDRNVPRNVVVEQPITRVSCPAGSTWDGKGCWKGR